MTDKIIPFRCSSCNVPFSPEEGGKCHRCNRVFCSNHLFTVKEDKELIHICLECNRTGRGKREESFFLRLKEKLGRVGT